MKKNKKLTTAIIVLILYFLYPYFLGYLLPSVVNSNSLQIVIRALFDLVFIAVLFILYKDEIKKEFKVFKKHPVKIILTSLGFFLLGFILMPISTMLLYNITGGELASSHSQVGISTLWPASPVYAVWLTFIVSPITDEIAFRKTFKNIVSNKVFYVIISSLVYGFYMIGYTATSLNDVLCIIPYALFGVAISISYLKTKTIFSPMLIRIIYSGWMLLGVVLGQV